MVEILLIRHGETDWNAEKRLQGHLDIELNAEGRRQAQALAEALRGEDLGAVFASDLQRARHTAAPLAAMRGLPVQIEPQLRERCYGAFEGLRYADIGERYPEAYQAMLAREPDARFPMGANRAETLREFSERSLTALGAVVKRAVESAGLRRIAVVTHGGVLDCINRAARGLDLAQKRDFDIPNAGINRLSWKNGAMQIHQWADVAHLPTALDEVAQ
ncbi:MAG: histidine phosphatase family protein [Burkholderiaceae bacterium]|nr:histidine phosphatase family protein [Burkholderiaceae bacterium]